MVKLSGGILHLQCEVESIREAFIERRVQQKKYLVSDYEEFSRNTKAYRRNNIR